MNPWEWFKWLYETAEFRNPIAWGAVFALIGSGVGLIAWYRLDSQFKKEHPPTTATYSIDTATSLNKIWFTIDAPKVWEPEIKIAGPDKVSIRIFKRQNKLAASFLNDGEDPTGKLDFRNMDTRSYKASESLFRNPEQFQVHFGEVPPIRAGHESKEAYTIIKRHPDKLEMADRGMREFLDWPPIDAAPTQIWLLGMKVFGLSTEWTIRLDVRWQRGSDVIEIREHDDHAPVDSY